ncbi:uncharacterized protein ColSpa_01550 [Colletotrichum spaethianum]|uniref:Uncharacterized protein n=1 Tax=Colletotrichum spaethianum TaxID=700344 RepID=A0AA37L7E8_9PEZI|nr:uncharacterized protein ColSpa_01550 [Colletotrichum spaethianum]GKT41369.1 hypothetical protein ColSpa_01550 [Colletotrichum spaethianum]
MLETCWLKLQSWKGSMLTGLVHSLEPDTRDRLRVAELVEQMDEHAKATMVRLAGFRDGPEPASVDVEGQERVSREE